MSDSSGNTLPALEKRVRVRLAVADAFDLFTREMVRWWPLRQYSCSLEAAVAVTIEPGVGRAVYETDRDGKRHPWGVVTQWDPPHAFAMTWHPAQLPERATRLSVRFAALAEGGCELTLVHDGWEARGESSAEARNAYDNGWPGVLQLYADAAAAGT